MSFNGELPCIRCGRKTRIPNEQTTHVHGKTSQTLFKVPCDHCKEDFYVEIRLSANNPYPDLKLFNTEAVK